jgi:isopentenyl diphosphate isomerase/L-lactate dehydrogenase-like FMN-dependent dehydrogenase
MAHRQAELAVARAAGEAGIAFALSTISSYPFEEVAGAATGPRWFQLYPAVFEGKLAETLGRVKEAGFYALCVTVDSAVSGIRERDVRNNITIPLRLTPRLMFEVARRPRWATDFLRGGVGQGSQGMGPRRVSYADALKTTQLSARPVTLDEIAEIRRLWSGPLVVKGILRGEDCPALLNLGVDGIVVSNHGGRFLDTVPATISVLPHVVDAVNGKAEVFIDGGIRRGVDVVKALALGAHACLIGRPYLYGLTVGGQAGVARVIDILRMEIDRTLALVGCRHPLELDRSHVGSEP